MRKTMLPRLLLINILFSLIGLLAWRIPFSSLLSTYYFNQALSDLLVNGSESHGIRDYLSRSVELDPNNYTAHYLLGTFYYQEKDYVNAAKEFETSLSISPLNTTPYYLLAESYFELGQFELASRAYLEAIKWDPMNIDYLTTALERFQKMGRDYEYFVSLYRLAALTPDFGERLKYSSEMSKVFERSTELIQISTGAPLGFGRQTSAVQDRNGTLYLLAYSNNYPSLIILSSSIDDGKTWIITKLLYVVSSGVEPDGTMAIDQGGTVHLFYGDKGNQSVYTNSKSNFDLQISLPETGDARQLGVDSDGVVHLVWSGRDSTIFHSKLEPSGSWSDVEIVANGTYPSLGIDGNKLIVTYNLNVSFPNPIGHVMVSEKTDHEWSEGLRISKEGVWAGASVVRASDGTLNVLYIENSKPKPVLVYARRDKQRKWIFSSVDETYFPYIPQNLPFGGRTAPGMEVINHKVYFLWRSGVNFSPILLKTFDLKTGEWENAHILDTLQDATFSYAPSFLASQFPPDFEGVLWAKSGLPVIYFP